MFGKGVYTGSLRLVWRKFVIITLFVALILYSMVVALIQPAMTFAAEGSDTTEETETKQSDEILRSGSGDNFLGLQVKAALLMEASTGQILYYYASPEARDGWEPASMVKMMTEYLVLEAIQQGKINWDTVVTITKRQDSVGGSGQLLAAGHKYTVKDLFNHMSIYSANDAAVALAETVAGTEELFVDMMNEKAKQFGLSEHTHFSNATGLPNEYYGEYAPNTSGVNWMTVHDAAIIARRLLFDHPEILEFSSKPQEYRREGDTSTELMLNWNRMLESWIPLNNLYSKLYAYEGLDGLKTGHTNTAGYNFTGTAVRNGMRLISVVMGTENEDMRFGETRKLLDYGFTNYEIRTVVTAKTEMEQLPSVSIKRGKEKQVSLVTQNGLEIVMKKADTADALKITAEPVSEDLLVAPIKQGDVLGVLTVEYDNGVEPVKHTINLIATDEVKEAGWFTLLWRAIANFFSNIWNSILNLF